MKLDKQIELKLITEIKECFKDSKRDFQHTLAAVFYMKILIKTEGGDERILLPAIYLHDIGYHAKDVYTLVQRIEKKKTHMELGAKEADLILRKLRFNYGERKKIVHLISVHDKLDSIKTKDELMIMEADSLGALDSKRAKITFNQEEMKTYLKNFEERRMPRFKTKTGKDLLKELWAVENK